MATRLRGILGLLAAFAAVTFSGETHAYLKLVSGTTSVTETVRYAGHQRKVLFIKPSSPASKNRVPMLVLLHFGGGDGETMATLTEVSELVRDQGIWVMLPDGVDGGWNNDPANDTGIDDVGFLSKQIERAVRRYPVLRHRVYLAGFSNGGFEALKFACEKPGQVAAVAVVSAQLRKKMTCAPALPVPLAMISGTADPIVNYNAKVGLFPAPETAARFATINGCTSGPRRTRLPDLDPGDGTRVYADGWSDCAQGARVKLYTVDGGGHTWPGSPFNMQGVGATTNDISGTLTVWEFVSQFHR